MTEKEEDWGIKPQPETLPQPVVKNEAITEQVVSPVVAPVQNSEPTLPTVAKNEPTSLVPSEIELPEHNSILDDKYRETDLPERMQLSSRFSNQSVGEDIQSEKEWILSRLKGNDALRQNIPRILEQYIEQHYEMSYILKINSHWGDMITFDDLWKVQQLDEEWAKFIAYKTAVKSQMVSDSRVTAAFHAASTMDELNDVKIYNSFISASTSGVYYDTKISECCAKLAISADDFARNIKEGKQMSLPIIPSNDLFEHYICSQFPRVDNIKSTCLMFCTEQLASHPTLIQSVREHFLQNAVVTTLPKPMGTKELLPTHRLYRVKHLCNKPLSSFEADLWLDIEEAIKKSLINMTMTIPENVREGFLNMLRSSYIAPNDLSHWNEMRKYIIDQMYQKLIARFSEDIKRTLHTEAENYVINKCKEKFKKLVIRPCIQPVNRSKAMGIAIDKEIYICIVSDAGKLLHSDKLESLSKKNANALSESTSKITSLIHLYKPEVISILYDTPDAIIIQRKITKITATENVLISTCTSNINPEAIPEGKTLQEKKSIAAAKYALNPLKYMCNFWDEDITKNGVLKLNLHKNQLNVDYIKLSKQLEAVMIDIINFIGCDLSESYQVMQFVCGLGVRKAVMIKKCLKTDPTITKNEFISKNILGKCVATNAMEFIVPYSEQKQFIYEPSELPELFADILKEPLLLGQIVEATNYKTTGSIIKCKLANKLSAKLAIGALPPNSQIFQCRINSLNIGKDHYEISVSTKPDDISSNDMLLKNLELDKSFAIDEEDRKLYLPNLINYIPRCIIHQYFKNVSQSQAIEFLSKKEAGEFIIRPSSKGDLYLTLTMKLFGKAFFNVSIKEENKQPTETIGKSLRITSHVYNSLDELVQNYADPMKKYALMMVSHRKFHNLITTVDEFKQKLIEDRNKTPDIITYGFAIIPEFVQTILLGYCPQKDVFIKEYIQVKAQGYFFHSKFFKNPDELIEFFKTNMASASYHTFLLKFNYPPQAITDDDTNIQEQVPDPIPQMLIPSSNEQKTPKVLYTEYHTNDFQMETLPANPISEGMFTTYQPNAPIGSNENSFGGSNYGRKSGDFERPGPMTCFKCHKPGHKSYECPEANGDDFSGGRRRGRGFRRGDRRGGGRGRRGFNSPDSAWGSSNGNGGGSNSNDDWGSFNSVEKKPEASTGSNDWGDNSETKKEGNDGWGTTTNTNANTEEVKMDSSDGWGGESRGRGSRRGGGGMGMGGDGCRYCHKEGHMIRECPELKAKEQQSKCFNCQQMGHSARNCPNEKKERSREASWERDKEPTTTNAEPINSNPTTQTEAQPLAQNNSWD